ncbi:MAG: MFS transporter [Candidatus Lokiarchaeota archaeon]|nr:MFS transporter [Candidatus Lokiarchaeota archaeon]
MILTLVSVIIKNFILFLLAFLIQGVGFSFINPTILAILSIISPEKKEGLVYGIYNSSAGVGVSLGAFLSGFLANYLEREWRVLFILNPLIAFIALIFFTFALKDCELLVCRTFEFNESESSSINKLKSKIKATFIQLKKALNLRIILLGVLGFLCFFVVITLTNTLNEQIRLSLSHLSNMQIITIVSLILTINGLISISLSPITGYLLNKVNPLLMIGIGFLLMSSMVFMPYGTSIPYFMIISFTTYMGSAFIWPALFELSMNIDRQTKGTNSAIINSFRFTGYAMVGPVYLICGIPVIYLWVSISIIIGITIILLYRKI